MSDIEETPVVEETPTETVQDATPVEEVNV